MMVNSHRAFGFSIAWFTITCIVGREFLAAQFQHEPSRTETNQFISNPYFFEGEATSPVTAKQPLTANRLPDWPTATQTFDQPSVLPDWNGSVFNFACDCRDDVGYAPNTNGFRHPSTPSQVGRRGLNQAYDDVYRSRMPSLKKVRDNDPCYDFGQPDLFGSDAIPADKQKSGLSKGRWFGRYEALLTWPYYSNGHSGLVREHGVLEIVEPFEYNVIYGSRGVVGWESDKGPGGQFQYTDVFAVSQPLVASATGTVTEISGNLVVPGSLQPFSINAGLNQRLEATAREHLTSYRPTVYKGIHFPISTITGGFGLDHTILRQAVSYASFSDANSQIPVETLNGRRRFSGIGPTFDIEYRRPIGHTQLAMLGGAQMGVLFGSDRWEVIRDNDLIYQNHSRRTITNANVKVGVEWSQPIGWHPQSRMFARLTIEGQNWLHVANFSSHDSSLGFLSGNFAVGAIF